MADFQKEKREKRIVKNVFEKGVEKGFVRPCNDHFPYTYFNGRGAISPTTNSQFPAARQGHTWLAAGAQCPVPPWGAQVCSYGSD